MEKKIIGLFQDNWEKRFGTIEMLPASGSARRYYRLQDIKGNTYIGAYNRNIRENRLFIDFSRHFLGKGLRVPEIYCESADGLVYIQEDLGNVMLLDAVEEGRQGEALKENVMELYRKALTELLKLQLLGGEGLDYSGCMPRPVFDRQCILWDLNYFKYCYLRLAGVDFDEQKLEDDFMRLADKLCKVDSRSFMFRDFQSRNIMVKNEEVWFIDYQGGRQGALQYDVASLLYDAIARIPNYQREQLLDFYIDKLQQYRPIDRAVFRADYYRFVLVRLLQAMGAFGLRGLHEGKQHFIDSIQPGITNILSLFQPGKLEETYPEIEKVLK